MTKNQQILIELISFSDPLFSKSDRTSYLTSLESIFRLFSPAELALLYTDISLVRTFLQFLTEEEWLQRKEAHDKLLYHDFVSPYLVSELTLMPYIHQFFLASDFHRSKELIWRGELIERATIKVVKNLTYRDQKIFAKEVLKKLSPLFEHEESLQIKNMSSGSYHGLSLYRTYDALDQIFNLDYTKEKGMIIKTGEIERLYEGSGIGVQSGYSTLLNALRYLGPAMNSRMIDLGSGYGRLGIVIGLMRPDINFIGYEYVSHRTEVSRITTKNFEMSEHVQFITQDLSSPNFVIPDAEIYYLYDPFSQTTYDHVLKQLIKISKKQKISIATKGNARLWLQEIAIKEKWPSPLEFENGNLCLFQSAV